jgi:predicted O-methyltransferase YrrM
LRECIQPLTFSIRELKGREDLDSVESKRFATLLFSLQSGLSPVDFPLAKEIGLIADGYRSLYSPLEYHRWAGDTALHFSIASSLGKKGRLLFNIVRLLRCRDCLELGTAYGLSALFLCGGMRVVGVKGHLTTIELEEYPYSLASKMLGAKYTDSVTCIHGSTQDQLAHGVKTFSDLDFVFHDAGHTREDYITDFGAFVESLRRGATVLFDDINWDDRRWISTSPRTHEGWLEVVSHPREKRAVEINEEMGLLLIN